MTKSINSSFSSGNSRTSTMVDKQAPIPFNAATIKINTPQQLQKHMLNGLTINTVGTIVGVNDFDDQFQSSIKASTANIVSQIETKKQKWVGSTFPIINEKQAIDDVGTLSLEQVSNIIGAYNGSGEGQENMLHVQWKILREP